jgi:replicative DNA helicase
MIPHPTCRANVNGTDANTFDRGNPAFRQNENGGAGEWPHNLIPGSATLRTVDPAKETQRFSQIRDGLGAFMSPSEVVELRALGVSTVDYRRPHTQSGFFDFDHVDDMAQAALRLTHDAQGVYFTLNPLKRDVLARRFNRVDIASEDDTARDVDVARRARLLIDADPVRIAGVSAKDSEKANAKDVVLRVRHFLRERGWPDPVFADSGNGYHLLYDLDLPVDDGELVKRVLASLAHQFDTEGVKIDRAVFNPSRIVKLYGTLARKGDNIPDRPHRWASIIEIPKDRKVVPQELLVELAKPVQKSMAVSSTSPPPPASSRSDSPSGRARNYLCKMPGAVAGEQGHNRTFTAANVLVRGFALSVPDALPILKEWNASCQPPWTEKELLHKLEDAEEQDGPRGYLLSNPGIGNIVVASGFKADFINSTAFDELAIQHEWLIKKVLVARQPAIVGGPKKVLKTSTMIDLAVSLGSGKSFLNHFDVPRRQRVLVLSGESGQASIQNVARRVCKSKKIDLKQCDILWGFRLPWLSSQNDLMALSRGIMENGIEVVIIDPLYLCLLAGNAGLQASNVYQMGPLLLGVAQTCLDAGATPILVHHTTKTSGQTARNEGYEPLELDNLAFAGVAEFARQWMILSRREKYDSESGEQKLWFNVGGSAGHSGLYGLDIREGILNDRFSGREWLVSVQTATNARDAAARAKREQKDKEKQARDVDDRAKVLRALEMYPDGETAKAIGNEAGIGNRSAGVLLDLLRELQVVRTTIRKACGRNPSMSYPGWRLWRSGERRPMTTNQSERLRKGEPIETVFPDEADDTRPLQEAQP